MSTEENMKMKRIYQLIMAVAGTVLTWLLWNPNISLGYAGISNIIASAGLALAAGLIFKKHYDIFFAGTFAGMCSVGVIPNIGWALLLGFVVFVVWMLLEKVLIGCGGKFGTIALISGLIVTTIIVLVVQEYTHPIGLLVGTYANLDWIAVLGGIGLGALACMATLYLRNKGELVKNTTVASAIVGLLGAFALLWITAPANGGAGTPDQSYGFIFSAVVYTASFAGMASKDRLKAVGKINEYLAFAITGAISACILFSIWGILCMGGKYGFSGLVAVLIYNQVILRLLNRKKAA